MLLIRTQTGADGVFGELWIGQDQVAVTLEHAYANGLTYAPKIPLGEYECVKGDHRLKGMSKNFETFEIMNVPGHSNCLIHWGNFNDDSAGCVLVGERIETLNDTKKMITHSRDTFLKLMDILKNDKDFCLKIIQD